MTEKKLDKDTALAKIKAVINKYYEEVGRNIVEDIDESKQELIDRIDEILNQSEISTKHLVIEKLELDDEIKDSLKGKWK